MLISLRNYSNYSICESNIKIEDLVDFASKNNFNAIGLTDYKLLSGSLEFSIKCQKAGIQPIIGIDVDYKSSLDHLTRVTLLSKSEEGFKNINLLSTEINTKNNFLFDINNIKDFAKDNILILGGLYSYFHNISVNEKNLKKVLNEIKNLKEIFKSDLYFEYDPHLNNKLLKEVSLKLEIPLFQSFFSFYKSKNDFDAMQILHCVKNGEYLQNSSFNISNQYSLDRSLDNFENSLIINNQLIAQKINFLIKEKSISLPSFSKGLSSDEDTEVIKQSRSGLDLRLNKIFKNLSIEEFNQKSKIYRDRLEYELNVIIKMKFSGYFLIVSDFIRWAKSQSIPVGPGRGSGAGSIVAWSLLITDVDPIQFGLLFERFLNPDRVSMPDFDIDFCESRRDEVIEYVQKKYGYQNVAQIITFGTMKSRSILRDVGRVLQMPYGQVDRLCKLVPNNPANPVSLKEAVEGEPRL